MSGVGALLSLNEAPLTAEQWQPMAHRLQRYGQDGQRVWHAAGEPAVLMHALFAITPQDRHTCAPAASADGRWLLVADIRLDAREELAEQLSIPAAVAADMTDEQLAANAFAQWNEDAAAHLLGGFAIIAWQRQQRRLHLLVDANGEKHLYMYRGAGLAAVSNRAPPLLAVPAIKRSVDIPALLDFFTDQRQAWRTTLAGIESIPPGHGVSLDTDGTCRRLRWWSPPDLDAWRRFEHPDAVDEFLQVFATAIRDRLRCRGNPGGLCSGGLDSTSVSSLAAAVLAKRGMTYRTYTSVPHPKWQQPMLNPRREHDERPYVTALVRSQPNIDATFVAADGTIFLDCLPELFAGTAWPVHNTANMPWLFAIWDVMREDGVRLPLSGNRGNSTISFDGPLLYDLASAGRLDLLMGEFSASPSAFAVALRDLLSAATQTWSRRSFPRLALAALEKKWQRRVALRVAAARAHGLTVDISKYCRAWSTAEMRRRFQRIRERAPMSPLEIETLQRPLTDTDPTADRRIAELCWSLLPTEYRHGTERRRLVRRAMVGHLPDEIRLRTTRGAQAPDTWMHLTDRLDDLREAVEFLAEDTTCRELLDIERLRGYLRHWPKYSGSVDAQLIPFERSLSMGLYLRWIGEGLTDLPGAKTPAAPLIERLASPTRSS